MEDIVYKVSAEKEEEFKTCFLKANPVPLDEKEESAMPEEEWIKELGKRFFIREYKRGKRQMHGEGIEFDEEVIE